MPVSGKFFHDRLVLLLCGISGFLTFFGGLLVILRLDSSHSGSNIIEFRANMGFGDFKTGSSLDIASFAIYLIINFILAILISQRLYPIKRSFAVMVLSLSCFLGLLAIIVSNALLVLR